MTLDNSAITYLEQHRQEALELLLALAPIPAPSNREERRAEFCLNWLQGHGITAHMDSALNVICPFGDHGQNPLSLIMAHSDVVFEDAEALPLRMDGERIYCPGICDDTANAAALMMAAKYISDSGLSPRGLLLVINSGEEGLGNLKGCRAIMEKYGRRVKEFISFDAIDPSKVVNRAVGSMRYQLTFTAAGGHSFNDFGNPSAIYHMALAIQRLHSIPLPQNMGAITFNVGKVSGGTSVNTIPERAQMLYEFRSDTRQGLEYMSGQFHSLLDSLREEGMNIQVELLGRRPGTGCPDPAAMVRLQSRAAAAIGRHFGLGIQLLPGSTDCNIPLSMDIPAICLGCCRGGGAHTREEYMELSSLLPGLKVALEMVLGCVR